jgi:hypothetical protein
MGGVVPAEAGETERWSWWIDAAAVYLATVYPLAFWMTSLPRNFQWFVANDFFALPAFVETVFFPLYVIVLTAYFAKSVYLYKTKGFLNPGKDIVVATTAVCWYVGIVAFNSDYAFTVTNVIIHGVPYFAFDLVLREESSGIIEPILSHAFESLDHLSREPLGPCIYRRALLEPRRVARADVAVRGELGLDRLENVAGAAASRAAIDPLRSGRIYLRRRRGNRDLKFM